MPSLTDRLNALDERVLRLSERRARLQTPEGWLRYTARWRWWALAGAGYLVFAGFAPDLTRSARIEQSALACVLFFTAGRLKAEQDRALGRGLQERLAQPAPPRLRRVLLGLLVGLGASAALIGSDHLEGRVSLALHCQVDGRSVLVGYSTSSTQGRVAAVVYDYGDSSSSTGALPQPSDLLGQHVYSAPGSYRIRATAVTDEGRTARSSCRVRVS